MRKKYLDALIELRKIYISEIKEHGIIDRRFTVLPRRLQEIINKYKSGIKFDPADIKTLNFARKELKNEVKKYKILIFITGKRKYYAEILDSIDDLMRSNFQN